VTQNRHPRDDARYPRRCDSLSSSSARAVARCEKCRAPLALSMARSLLSPSPGLGLSSPAYAPSFLKEINGLDRLRGLFCFLDSSLVQSWVAAGPCPGSTLRALRKGQFTHPSIAKPAPGGEIGPAIPPPSRIEDHQRRADAVGLGDGMLPRSGTASADLLGAVRCRRIGGGYRIQPRGPLGRATTVERGVSDVKSLLRASGPRRPVSWVLVHITAWMIHSNQDKHSNHIVARCSP
jgi:hypothetical protein